MPNIDRKPVIRNFYIKQSSDNNSSSVYGHPIGVESCYSKLNPVTTYNISNNPSATASTTSYKPVYEDNVQAEMIRKGYQVNYLRNRLQGAISYMQTVSDQADEIEERVDGLEERIDGLEDKTIYDSDVNLTGNSTEGSKKAILDGTSVTDTDQLSTLAAAIPYMVQVDYQNANSTITAYDGDSPLILGRDGIYNIGSKFNALTNRVQNLEHSFMSDDELINRYYTQGQHYCIYNSNIQSQLGYPHIDSTTNRIVPNGHMRYLVYEGTVSSTAAVGSTESRPNNCKTVYYKNKNTTTTYAYSIYRGKLLGETYTVNSPYTLYDKEYLPTPPAGYRWRCVYVRGTNPAPTQTESATGENQLWQILDGYHTYTGYISGSKKALSADLNIPNLYKGTNYNNLGGIITQEGKTFSRVATQKPNQWKSLLVCTDQNEVFDTFSNASAYNGYGVLFKNLLIRGNDARVYQNNRIYGKRGKVGSAHETDSTKIEAFQKIGSKFNPEEKIRVELLTSNSTEGSSWYVAQDGTVGSLSQGAVGISLLNFPITLYYKQPFMYAEYTLVRDTGNISAEELYYWYNNTITTTGDEEDESSEG